MPSSFYPGSPRLLLPNYLRSILPHMAVQKKDRQVHTLCLAVPAGQHAMGDHVLPPYLWIHATPPIPYWLLHHAAVLQFVYLAGCGLSSGINKQAAAWQARIYWITSIACRQLDAAVWRRLQTRRRFSDGSALFAPLQRAPTVHMNA